MLDNLKRRRKVDPGFEYVEPWALLRIIQVMAWNASSGRERGVQSGGCILPSPRSDYPFMKIPFVSAQDMLCLR